MKFISILLSALFLVSCQLNDKQRNRALDLTEQFSKPVSYYLIAKAVQAHVEDNPQCKALILEIADILKLGTISMVKAKVKVEAILLKANIPVLERKLISQALWDTVEFDDLGFWDEGSFRPAWSREGASSGGDEMGDERDRARADEESEGATVGAAAASAREAMSGTEAHGDVNTNEATRRGVKNDGDAFAFNLKGLMDAYSDLATTKATNASQLHDTEAQAQAEHRANLRQITTQLLQNSVDAQDKRRTDSGNIARKLDTTDHGEANRLVRHSDLAVDRIWNADEVAALVSKTPVLLDALMSRMVVESTKKEEGE